MTSVKEKVNTRINSGKKVVIFSKSYCPFCKKAKAVFKKYLGTDYLSSEDYDVWEIENETDCKQIQKELDRRTGAGSVPRVFIQGEFVGGGDDIVRLDAGGGKKLIEKLTSERKK